MKTGVNRGTVSPRMCGSVSDCLELQFFKLKETTEKGLMLVKVPVMINQTYGYRLPRKSLLMISDFFPMKRPNFRTQKKRF